MPGLLIDNPSFLSALTDAQAQRINTTLGLSLGDQSTRARLARMLMPINVLPDNPDWQTLKAGEPLAKLIKDLANKLPALTEDYYEFRHLLLGTLTACTRHDKYSRNQARRDWEKAKSNPKTRPMVIAAAGRNIYRAILLGEAGDYKSQYVQGKGDAHEEIDLWFGGSQGNYEKALVLLDQSPLFPPIGVQQKKEARRLLTKAAAAGYEPAQAKLKEL